MMQGHLELRGNAYAVKVSGNGRAIDQLIPLHPDRVRVFLLPNQRLRYEVTAYSTGQIDRYSQDEILHVRGLSYDGIMGISTVSAMAEVIGVGLAQQQHRARYFHNSAIPSLSIESPVKMDDDKREQMINSISEKFSGEGALLMRDRPAAGCEGHTPQPHQQRFAVDRSEPGDAHRYLRRLARTAAQSRRPEPRHLLEHRATEHRICHSIASGRA